MNPEWRETLRNTWKCFLKVEFKVTRAVSDAKCHELHSCVDIFLSFNCHIYRQKNHFSFIFFFFHSKNTTCRCSHFINKYPLCLIKCFIPHAVNICRMKLHIYRLAASVCVCVYVQEKVTVCVCFLREGGGNGIKFLHFGVTCCRPISSGLSW